MTKKQERLLNQYQQSINFYGFRTSLLEVYSSFSLEKANALRNCIQRRLEVDGYGATIVSASSHFFTYAYKFIQDGKEWLCFETHANTYKFCIE